MNKSIFCALSLLLASLLSCSPAARAAELLINGSFVTNTSLPANGYSSNVGRTGSSATYILSGTGGSAGWFTTEADGLFEVWTPGYLNGPANVGNTLELANDARGATIYQDVTSSATGPATATLSFGYSDRDSGLDAFTAMVTDRTTSTVIFTQAFNPTGSFSTATPFSIGLTVTPGDVYRIAFLDQNTTTGGTQGAHIDQVSFVQGVPEPSPLAAALIAGVGLVVFARRRTSGQAS